MSTDSKNNGASAPLADYENLEDLVASTDTGGRNPEGWVRQLLVWTAIAWSLFQLYYASDWPFKIQGWLHAHQLDLNVVVDATRARSIHLAFALFLAFLSYPASRRAPKNYVPAYDWIFAVCGAFLAAYYLFFYDDIVRRIGAPNSQDVIAGICGILLLLEATRRSLGLPLVLIALVFLLYNYVGQFFPFDWIISHRSGSLTQIINQQWISTEGVFGVALDVSTRYVFLFVLFGSLLDKAGAGNYFIQCAFAYLGHLRGGPAKAAVVASGLTGLISGSSIANVVTTGTFTIPMMKRVGFPAEKAGAVEVASSVNGQIMPPVMGAAAFLMIEYINMPYSELIKHAFLPALISYIALVYIVHLEACKSQLQGLERSEPARPWQRALLGFLGGLITLCLLSFAVYYGLGWIHRLTPAYGEPVIYALLFAVYVLLLRRVARYPDLQLDDPDRAMLKLPRREPTVNAGLHFLLPVAVLIWFLMVEQKSPGLSAYKGALTLIFIQLTQRPLLALFRRQGHYGAGFKTGLIELRDGLEAGARNMIGIGIATACAGIIVGVVSLTGFGVQLADIIDKLSGGSLILMLVLVALFSLILGMGLPTTANYIVVSSLMAVVIVEVGSANGLVVPLVAVHLFVFYFGIMADVTPPVGLASFAAAAISGGDPIRTGLVAFTYSLRTALLPFFFIFNTDLLLINVNWAEGVLIFIVSVLAMLAFTAATMGYFFTRSYKYESLLLLLVTALLFNPGYFMNKLSPSKQEVAPAQLVETLATAPTASQFLLQLQGVDDLGNAKRFFVQLPVLEGADGTARLQALGLTLRQDGEKLLVDEAALGSVAQKNGLDWDQEIVGAVLPTPHSTPKQWLYLPAIGLLVWLARRQIKRRDAEAHAPGV